MNHFRPLIHPVVAVLARGGREHGRVRSRAVRLGHREAGADLAGGQRAKPLLLLIVVRDDLQQVHVALVGRGAVERVRAEQRVPRRLEHHRHGSGVESEAAPFLADVRRQQPRILRLGHQLALQRVVEPVRAFARVPLAGDDHVADEGFGARLERGKLGGQAEVDHRQAPPSSAPARRPVSARYLRETANTPAPSRHRSGERHANLTCVPDEAGIGPGPRHDRAAAGPPRAVARRRIHALNVRAALADQRGRNRGSTDLADAIRRSPGSTTTAIGFDFQPYAVARCRVG